MRAGTLMRVEAQGSDVVFGGREPLEPANFVERSIAKKSAPEHRDLRDWDKIRGWAAAIAPELSGPGDPVATGGEMMDR